MWGVDGLRQVENFVLVSLSANFIKEDLYPCTSTRILILILVDQGVVFHAVDLLILQMMHYEMYYTYAVLGVLHLYLQECYWMSHFSGIEEYVGFFFFLNKHNSPHLNTKKMHVHTEDKGG